MSFILPHFHYSTSVWHFCSSRNSAKLQTLNKRILGFILQDKESLCSHLLEEAGTKSLYNKKIQEDTTVSNSGRASGVFS